MKKKKTANLLMAALIVLIVAAGVLCVGLTQGWFDRADGAQTLLTDIRGIVYMERDGLSREVESDTVLRAGDRLHCAPGATARLETADGWLVLAGNTELEITDPSALGLAAEVSTGEVFVHTASRARLRFDGRELELADCVALLSVRSGAQSLSLFAGTAGGAEAGQLLSWIGGQESVSQLALTSLNEFTIAQLRTAQDSALCFTAAQLDQLEAERLAQKQEALLDGDTDTEDGETPGAEDKTPTGESSGTVDVDPQPTPGDGSGSGSGNGSGNEEPAPETKPGLTCTLSIRCDTILNNWDDLDPAKAGYVPANGVILSTVTVSFSEGETVLDVLKRVCDSYGIQLEYSWSPMYNSYYVEGINHLYEFDCGSSSGWLFQVNGWFPNYGCSEYYLQGGENIVWCYTCSGFGADVGGGLR